jgi:Ca2+-binding RTX toxin-like protein
MSLPDYNDMTRVDFMTYNAGSGQFDVVGTHGEYAGVVRQVEWSGGYADYDGFIWADRIFVEAPNGTRLASIDAGDTPILLDLALDGEGGFSDVIDILGVDATGNNHANYMAGGRQGDIARGMGGNDRLYGNGGNDALDGGAGNDRLVGGAGNDLIIGGTGRDNLYGQSGADRFDFNVRETGDVIRDFDSRDYIDVSTIDANTRVAGNQAFSYIGDHGFTGRAGQLSYDDESGMLRMDVNGDRVTDGSIHVANEYDLASYDFIV